MVAGVRIYLVNSYRSSKRTKRGFVPEGLPLVIPFCEMRSEGFDAPDLTLQTRQGLDFDFDITNYDPAVIQSFRSGKLALLVKSDSLVLAEITPEQTKEIQYIRILNGEVVFCPPHYLYLSNDEVALVNLQKTFAGRAGIHIDRGIGYGHSMSARGPYLATVRDLKYLAVWEHEPDAEGLFKTAELDLSKFQDLYNLAVVGFCLGTTGLVVLCESTEEQGSYFLQYWKVVCETDLPTILCSLVVRPSPMSANRGRRAQVTRQQVAFVVKRRLTFVLVQNPEDPTVYAVFEVVRSKILVIVDWGKDTRLFPSVLQGQQMLASKFWYDAKTERLILAVDRKNEETGAADILFTRLKLV